MSLYSGSHVNPHIAFSSIPAVVPCDGRKTQPPTTSLTWAPLYFQPGPPRRPWIRVLHGSIFGDPPPPVPAKFSTRE
ncbi:hypothetical protein DPEC_G00255880 [Dallia pectoralis]|uniref:Uncharacterized protein n=1 Tax=Dallia pectoralis TaxID=75939 RepID=A0ACC2FUL1_DALPE|nr:hypothetical protein DPEC_G00255880 [Dallia pectoralis]